MLQVIEQYAVYLSDADQKRMIAFKVLIEAGRGKDLDPAVKNDIRNVYISILKELKRQYNAEPVLSLVTVLKNLLTAEKMLSTEEKKFFNAIAQKVVKKEAVSQEETEALLRLYTRKGF
jgi:hypothetical protein